MASNSQGQRITRASQQASKRIGCAAVIGMALLGLLLSASAQAEVFTVNSPSDVGDINPGDMVCHTGESVPTCTLRAAIEEANALPGADTINLQADTYLLTIGAELTITENLTITGGGASTTIIDGNKSAIARTDSGVLRVNNFVTVNIIGVTVRNGGKTSPFGGGITNDETLTLTNSTVSGNSGVFGGGILNAGTLTLSNSTVSGNSANANGGGIFNNSGTSDLFNSTITNNRSDADHNSTGTGGGVFQQSGTFTFQNTIIANNLGISSANDDCFGALTTNGNNLMSVININCTVDVFLVTLANPMLGPLQNNGGPTQTHALLAGSPAMDTGNLTGCRDQSNLLLVTDQRGAERHFDGDHNGTARCDIGAHESGGALGIVADFDGDGKTDVAVYQTGTGNWFSVRSKLGFGQHLNFGGANFLPVPAGDYERDGEADTAVYGTSNGNWFIDQSTAGFRVNPSFGRTGFVPVMAQVTPLRAMKLL